MTFRPARIAVAVVVFMLIYYGAIAAYHPVRVWLARGTWCVNFMLDGSRQIRYGEKACGLEPVVQGVEL